MGQERVVAEGDLVAEHQLGALGLGALELYRPRFGIDVLDILQALQEVEVPHGAAELAVGDGLQARLFLLFHQVCDGGVLGGGQLLAGDGSGGEIGARLLEGLGAQEAADDVICVRGIGDSHGWRPFIAYVARERMPQACVIENYRFDRVMYS